MLQGSSIAVAIEADDEEAEAGAEVLVGLYQCGSETS